MGNISKLPVGPIYSNRKIDRNGISGYPLVSVVIPVGGTRVNDKENLLNCVRSICKQTYPNMEIILVIDPSNTAVRSIPFPCPVTFVEYHRPVNGVGRDEKERYLWGWGHATGKIFALTGVSLTWETNVVETALEIMRKEHVEAIDGITKRQKGDNRFLALFQDDAIISEFPPYKNDFLLSSTTFSKDLRLPSMTSFFITKGLYKKIRSSIPRGLDNGWGDFNVARAIINAGEGIFCTNRLIAYRQHKLSLRLAKQFSSGLCAARFYLDFPENAYSKKRLRLTLLVAELMILFILAAIISFAVKPLLGIIGTLMAAFLVFILAGAYNVHKAKYLTASLFPPLTAVQIAFCTLGYLYECILSGNPDTEFLDFLHHTR